MCIVHFKRTYAGYRRVLTAALTAVHRHLLSTRVHGPCWQKALHDINALCQHGAWTRVLGPAHYPCSRPINTGAIFDTS